MSQNWSEMDIIRPIRVQIYIKLLYSQGTVARKKVKSGQNIYFMLPKQ